jgi:hypothetical protein
MDFKYKNTQLFLNAKPPLVCHTEGSGLWSNVNRAVSTSRIKLEIRETEYDSYLSVTLNAYFPRKSWDTKNHGLIYTDGKWLTEFRKQFAIKFPELSWLAKNIDYTEQGMQGDSYVSLQFFLDTMKKIKRFGKSLDSMKIKTTALRRHLGTSCGISTTLSCRGGLNTA